MIKFRVVGEVQPQGSMTARVTKAGKAFVKPSNDHRLRKWRGLVAMAAEQAYQGQPLDQPVMTVITWGRPAPASKKGQKYDDTGYDIDKLERAVNDAITGVIVTNDSRIVRVIKEKLLGPPGSDTFVEITVIPLTQDN